MTPIEQAIQVAGKNPNSESSKELRRRIEGGLMDKELSEAGIKYENGSLVKVSDPTVTREDPALTQASVGLAKGILTTAKGLGALGQEYITDPLRKVIDSVAPVGEYNPNSKLTKVVESIMPEHSNILDSSTSEGQKATEALKANTPIEKVAKTGEQIAEYLVPGVGEEKLGAGATKLDKAVKIGKRALGSAGVATAQSGEVGADTAIAGATEVALPVVGGLVMKPAKRLLGKVLFGAGSALSGASASKLEQILANPEVAQMESKAIAQHGSDTVLEANAKTIVNGVSKIRQEARQAFGDGIESLAKTDIKEKVFRENTQKILDKYGSSVQGENRVLGNVEFDDPKNLQKASQFIDRLSTVDLNGKDLRKLADDIENSVYKTATSDERLSYNVFAKDLANSVKKAITDSSPKLEAMNKKYSADMQLAGAIEQEFGKVKFKNLEEVVRASKRVETMFEKSGLAPNVIDDFLNKIGAKNLKTSEAVRQVVTKDVGANSVGASPMEILRNLSSSIVTPKLVKNLAIIMSISDKKAKVILESLDPVARATLIKTLTSQD